jgi:hypothetical protein
VLAEHAIREVLAKVSLGNGFIRLARVQLLISALPFSTSTDQARFTEDPGCQLTT